MVAITNTLTSFQLLIGLAVAGLFTGLGSAIGTYLANRYITNKIERVKQIITNNIKESFKNGEEELRL